MSAIRTPDTAYLFLRVPGNVTDNAPACDIATTIKNGRGPAAVLPVYWFPPANACSCCPASIMTGVLPPWMIRTHPWQSTTPAIEVCLQCESSILWHAALSTSTCSSWCLSSHPLALRQQLIILSRVAWKLTSFLVPVPNVKGKVKNQLW